MLSGPLVAEASSYRVGPSASVAYTDFDTGSMVGGGTEGGLSADGEDGLAGDLTKVVRHARMSTRPVSVEMRTSTDGGRTRARSVGRA
jgi:hypothetical protein